MVNDSVLDLSMKNKCKLDDKADLIKCLSDEHYEMPTPNDEDLEIIDFDPAGTNKVTIYSQNRKRKVFSTVSIS